MESIEASIADICIISRLISKLFEISVFGKWLLGGERNLEEPFGKLLKTYNNKNKKLVIFNFNSREAALDFISKHYIFSRHFETSFQRF